ncbi:MAG: lytic transglycosylase domain-containing protein [Oxalobacter sp.]|nr:MAG: lytic transglycosylase domain-containing protein [Oxalobacter sp.]
MVLHRIKLFGLALSAALLVCQSVHSQPVELSEADKTFIALQEAATKDREEKAAALADQLKDYAIPSYVDYYKLKPRLWKAGASEVDAFLTRYSGTAIADRMRNDWLLELGRRRDWTAFDRHAPLFVLKDDLQVKCYELMSAAAKGKNVAEQARNLLWQPTKYGEGCKALIGGLAKNGQFNEDDVWRQIRLAGEYGLGSLAEQLAGVVGTPKKQVARAVDLPLLRLARGLGKGRDAHETFAIALGRLAKKNHEKAAAYVLKHLSRKLTEAEQGIAWAQIALPSSMLHAPEAIDYWRKAGKAPLSIEGHEWKVRTALRAGDWQMVKDAIEAMPPFLRSEPAWVYWLGRAQAAQGEARAAKKLYESISDEYHYYGQLALEELGHKTAIPNQADATTEAELWPMETNAGLARGLKFFSIGLRLEGMREWSWELLKMRDRELFAAAEYARQHQLLDRMINASSRTRHDFDFAQRYPTPYRDMMRDVTQQLGLDLAWVYGVVRQESRFIPKIRSSAGATGLMQVMPNTAKFVARKIKMQEYNKNQLDDTKINITLGTHYLKMVLNDLDGSQVLATAAYNAGPNRVRAWRAMLTAPMEGAIFAETIPFSETRGYVKHVMSNATYYSALFESRSQSLKTRLGTIAPKNNGNTNLP